LKWGRHVISGKRFFFEKKPKNFCQSVRGPGLMLRCGMASPMRQKNRGGESLNNVYFYVKINYRAAP